MRAIKAARALLAQRLTNIASMDIAPAVKMEHVTWAKGDFDSTCQALVAKPAPSIPTIYVVIVDGSIIGREGGYSQGASTHYGFTTKGWATRLATKVGGSVLSITGFDQKLQDEADHMDLRDYVNSHCLK